MNKESSRRNAAVSARLQMLAASHMKGYRFIFVWSGLVARSRWPGPGGPVPVARSRWPGPRWPGPGGPVPVPSPARFCRGPVARSRSRSWSRPRSLPSVLPMVWFWWPGGPVPVPVPAPVRSRSALVAVARSRSRPGPCPWPGPSPNKADHLCSAASFKQSLPGKWWFYAVLQTTGERQTILRSRNHYRTKTGAKRLPKPTA